MFYKDIVSQLSQTYKRDNVLNSALKPSAAIWRIRMDLSRSRESVFNFWMYFDLSTVLEA